jgi:hypothetical protein
MERIICPTCKGSTRSGKKLGSFDMPCLWCTASGYIDSQWEVDRIKRILNISKEAEQTILKLD